MNVSAETLIRVAAIGAAVIAAVLTLLWMTPGEMGATLANFRHLLGQVWIVLVLTVVLLLAIHYLLPAWGAGDELARGLKDWMADRAHRRVEGRAWNEADALSLVAAAIGFAGLFLAVAIITLALLVYLDV